MPHTLLLVHRSVVFKIFIFITNLTWLMRVHSRVNPIVFGKKPNNLTIDKKRRLNELPKPDFRFHLGKYFDFIEKKLQKII